MIKVVKDLNNVPASLNRGNTNAKRRGVISQASYTDTKSYNDCYKKKDTKDALIAIYNDKCCYCEQKLIHQAEQNKQLPDEKSIVEHYRPKSVYYSLAYSWDNLLLCCKKCSEIKDNNFDIDGIQFIYSQNCDKRIHTSTKIYNRIEKPKMIHPEMEDASLNLDFDEKGNIFSEDNRIKYTITTCGLDRTALNDKRKKLLDDFIKLYSSALLDGQDKALIEIKKFLAKNIVSEEFTAYRNWIKANLKNILTKLK